MARKRFSEKQKTALLAKFECWDGSVVDFCRKQGVSYQTLRNWRLKRQTGGKAAEFVEVELKARPLQLEQDATSPLAELDLGAGVILRVFRQS